MKERPERDWWLVPWLVVTVIIALVDAYEDLVHHDLAHYPWAGHPVWLKVTIHGVTLLVLALLLARPRRPAAPRWRRSLLVAGLMLVNVCATTRKAVTYSPQRVEVQVLGITVQAAPAPSSLDALEPCYHRLHLGLRHLVVDEVLLVVPLLPAPVEDHGFDGLVDEAHLCPDR